MRNKAVIQEIQQGRTRSKAVIQQSRVALRVPSKLGRRLIVHMPKVKVRLGADWNKLQQPANAQAGLRRLACAQRPSRDRQTTEQLLLLWLLVRVLRLFAARQRRLLGLLLLLLLRPLQLLLLLPV